MTDKSAQLPKIGYMGVGFMGHGAAKNILEKGYPLTVLGHQNREPVEDLLKRGAQEAHSPSVWACAAIWCSCVCPLAVMLSKLYSVRPVFFLWLDQALF
jgi:3-hydroxyisobutyrate dehydrogenase-like beta-hydroxyacid dehydrogenase